VTPSANLERESNVTVSFESSLFRTNFTDVSFFCGNKISFWKGIAISSNALNCLIPFENNQLDIQVFMNSSFSPKLIQISRNSHPFYYLTKGVINFQNESQSLLGFVSQGLLVNVSISTIIPPSLIEKIGCKLSDSSMMQNTNFTKSIENTHYFSCYLKSSTSGLKNISIWYKDSKIEFELSNNTIEVSFASNSNNLIQ
jgi:hypothetical protein